MEQLLFRLTKITTKNEKSPVWGYVPVSAQVLHRFSKKEKKKKRNLLLISREIETLTISETSYCILEPLKTF